MSSACGSSPSSSARAKRLFEDVDTSSLKLALADARKLANGSAILTYLPN